MQLNSELKSKILASFESLSEDLNSLSVQVDKLGEGVGDAHSVESMVRFVISMLNLRI